MWDTSFTRYDMHTVSILLLFLFARLFYLHVLYVIMCTFSSTVPEITSFPSVLYLYCISRTLSCDFGHSCLAKTQHYNKQNFSFPKEAKKIKGSSEQVMIFFEFSQTKQKNKDLSNYGVASPARPPLVVAQNLWFFLFFLGGKTQGKASLSRTL